MYTCVCVGTCALLYGPTHVCVDVSTKEKLVVHAFCAKNVFSAINPVAESLFLNYFLPKS